MSDATPKDIYSSRERGRAVVEERPHGVAGDRWFHAIQERWSTVLLFILLLLLVVTLVGVVYYQHQILSRGRSTGTGNAEPVQLAPPGTYAAPVDIDPAGRLVLDELADVEPARPPEGGVTNLTPHWVEQAAVHLRQAERAYEDGNWNSARQSYEQVRLILPEIERLDELIGLCDLRLKKYAEAAAVFETLVRQRSPTAALWNNLGVARMGQEQNKEAEEAFRKAMQVDPNYLPARQNLGLLRYRTGNMEGAAEVLAGVIRRDPGAADITLTYAVALLKLERWKAAASVLEEAGRLNPSAPIFFRLAEARSHTGDMTAAMEALRRGVDLVDVKAAMVWLNRPELEPLRTRPDFQKLITDVSQAIP